MNTRTAKTELPDPGPDWKTEQAVLKDLREELALLRANRARSAPLSGESAVRLKALEKDVPALARTYAERDGTSKPDALALFQAKETLLAQAIRDIEGRRVGRFIRRRVK